jgi:hypothetical protein
VDVAVIKWIVIAVLVAGTFGIVWSAPWKDDVERAVDSVQTRIDAARRTLDVLDGATGGDCKAVGTAAPENVTQAVDVIADEAEKNPEATLRGVVDGVTDPTVREVARSQAEQIGECVKSAPRTGAGWVDLKNRLERAAAG